VIQIGACDSEYEIRAGWKQTDNVDAFCYLGSIITNESNIEKTINGARIGKASGVFGKLSSTWKHKQIGIKKKTRLYEALVLSTLRYGAETWSKYQDSRLYKWLRGIIGDFGGNVKK